MDMEIRTFDAWMRAALLAVIVIFCTSCIPTGRDNSQGVRLIFDEANLAPGSSFELRFDQEVAGLEEVGKKVRVSPLIISPPIEGEFVWLSQRSGLFTPWQPLGLGANYLFTLRAGLNSREGTPLTAKLHRRIRTPDFQVTEYTPRWGDHGNCPARPLVQIEF